MKIGGNPQNLTRKGMGRPKGSKNKQTLSQVEWARLLIESDEYRASAARRILAGRASHLESLYHEATTMPRKSAVDLSGQFTIRWAGEDEE